MELRNARTALTQNSAWEDGLNLIEELLQPGSATAAAMTDEQQHGLKKLKLMLLSGVHSNENHIPFALLLAGDSANNSFLLSNFAGYVRPEDPSQRFKEIVSAHRVARKLKTKARSSRMQLVGKNQGTFLPALWFKLESSAQRLLRDLLSWENLCRWDFDIFLVDQVLGGRRTLLFVAWAILAAPHSQNAMDVACQLADTSPSNPPEDNDRLNGSSTSITHARTETTPVADRPGYRFLEQLGIKEETLVQFLNAIENMYIDNPYHNKIHAADVTQTLHVLLHMGGSHLASDDPMELFALLIAAVVHDVGHPGMNNSYQVSSKSECALIYNDKSVLENMHASRAFRLIMGEQKDTKCDLLASFTDEQTKKFRDIVIKTVLSTDMTKHFAKKNFIKGIVLNSELKHETAGTVVDTSDPTTKLQILGYILHLADISNPTKPTGISTKWTDRVLKEFFRQGDKEAELALPISPLCDRRTTSRAQSQIGFIKFIVLPAYELLSELIPQVETSILPEIRENLKYWEEQEKLEEQTDDKEKM